MWSLKILTQIHKYFARLKLTVSDSQCTKKKKLNSSTKHVRYHSEKLNILKSQMSDFCRDFKSQSIATITAFATRGGLHEALFKGLLFLWIRKIRKVELKDEYYNRECAQKQNHLHQESLEVVLRKGIWQSVLSNWPHQ